MEILKDKYSILWKMFIRPPRDSNYSDSSLGPEYLMLPGADDFKAVRKNFEIRNSRDQVLKCTHYIPYKSGRKNMPCVIFLHGNSSSRGEAVPYLNYLLPKFISVFCFDFAGSGKSDGKYVSLGYYERWDVKAVVNHLRTKSELNPDPPRSIALWGRSMGAATTLMYSIFDPELAAIAVDSPFSDIVLLARELVQNYLYFPDSWFDFIFKFIKESVETEGELVMDDLDIYSNYIHEITMPAIFLVAKEDNFILPSHGKRLYEKYKGSKKWIEVAGDHNSSRPKETLREIAEFLEKELYKTDTKANQEEFKSDESPSQKGPRPSDKTPLPYPSPSNASKPASGAKEEVKDGLLFSRINHIQDTYEKPELEKRDVIFTEEDLRKMLEKLNLKFSDAEIKRLIELKKSANAGLVTNTQGNLMDSILQNRKY